jgi:hypothetical protein
MSNVVAIGQLAISSSSASCRRLPLRHCSSCSQRHSECQVSNNCFLSPHAESFMSHLTQFFTCQHVLAVPVS